MLHSVRMFVSTLLLFTAVCAAWPQTSSRFSGLWKQDDDRCQPPRSGDATLRLDEHGPDLTVETTLSRNSAASRHALQKYTTDGKVSVSIGADGDEFQTSVIRKDGSLIFSIEEHEDGRILLSKETWSVIEDGATLERIRERPNGDKQVFFYRKDSPRCEQ